MYFTTDERIGVECRIRAVGIDRNSLGRYSPATDCGVEQLAARRAHNPEVAGSSPAPANRGKR